MTLEELLKTGMICDTVEIWSKMPKSRGGFIWEEDKMLFKFIRRSIHGNVKPTDIPMELLGREVVGVFGRGSGKLAICIK